MVCRVPGCLDATLSEREGRREGGRERERERARARATETREAEKRGDAGFGFRVWDSGFGV
jgi:hypothetical protein